MSDRQLEVHTNLFPISRLPTKTFWHYKVDFVRKIPTKKPDDGPKRPHQIIDRLQQEYASLFTPRAIFDGKANLFSTREVIKGEQSFGIDMAERVERRNGKGFFTVTMTLVGTIEPSVLNKLISGRSTINDKDRMAVNVLQLLVRQAPSMSYPHNVRSVFTQKGSTTLRGGLELWRGYFQSVRPAIGKMVINVDTSTAIMYRHGELVGVALDFLGFNSAVNARELSGSKMREQKWLQLQHFLKGVIVSFKYGKSKPQPIEGIVDRAGHEIFHREDEGDEISVMNHYLEAHNFRLAYPDIFGVKTRSGSIFPAEVCIVEPGQFYKRSITADQTRAVLAFAVKKPTDRLASILNAQSVLHYETSHFMSQVEMQVDFRPLPIRGQILSVPRIQYGGKDAYTTPSGGSWNVMQKRFFQPTRIRACAVVVFDHRSQGHPLKKFVETLISCCIDLGMEVPRNLPRVQIANSSGSIAEILLKEEEVAVREAGGRPGIDRVTMIICILPQFAAPIRKEIKHWGDVEQGIPTQCIRGDKLAKANSQYCNNVALKINVKLGGVNSIISSPGMNWFKRKDMPVMVVGADVGHPGPGVMRPSVTALVASVDQNASQYVAFSNVQAQRQEIINDLEQMMQSTLEKFGEKWGFSAWPREICFFRDGVSEGEFEKVAEEEIGSIKAAIESVWLSREVTAPKPTLTFVVVGKRHHVRFFPLRPEDGDRSGNCPPGFAVHDKIVQPRSNYPHSEFYLMSHGGLLGTSRPAHYTVLHDENNLSGTAEKLKILEDLSYSLCHTFARATRSVSIPAPVYYADLVCTRANFHFKDLEFSETSSIAASTTSDNKKKNLTAEEVKEWKDAFQHPHESQMRGKMYWM